MLVEVSVYILIPLGVFAAGMVAACFRFFARGGKINLRKWESRKSKRIKEFHKEYEENCSSWLEAVFRECNIKQNTQASVNLHRLFGRYQAKNFAAAIKMMR